MRDAVVCLLICVSPWVAFLRHNQYPLGAGEVLVPTLLLSFGSALLGMGLSRLVFSARVLAYALLCTLWLDFRGGWFLESQWPGVCFVFASAFVVLHFLRRRLSEVLLWAFSAIALVAFLEPHPSSVTVESAGPSIPARRPPADRILHLVLDEQIGLDGIPDDVDAGRETRKLLQELLVSHGFRVFSQAYSRHYMTSSSLSNLFNFADESSWSPFYDEKRFSGNPMSGNGYFRHLREEGYRLHVFQTGYMDFCRTRDGLSVERCETVPSENLADLAPLSLPLRAKIRLVTSVFLRLSFVARTLGG